jgi:hypothetical protein
LHLENRRPTMVDVTTGNPGDSFRLRAEAEENRLAALHVSQFAEYRKGSGPMIAYLVLGVIMLGPSGYLLYRFLESPGRWDSMAITGIAGAGIVAGLLCAMAAERAARFRVLVHPSGLIWNGQYIPTANIRSMSMSSISNGAGSGGASVTFFFRNGGRKGAIRLPYSLKGFAVILGMIQDHLFGKIEGRFAQTYACPLCDAPVEAADISGNAGCPSCGRPLGETLRALDRGMSRTYTGNRAGFFSVAVIVLAALAGYLLNIRTMISGLGVLPAVAVFGVMAVMLLFPVGMAFRLYNYERTTLSRLDFVRITVVDEPE